eukprot:3743746-Rhodomonas_salina.1
MSLNLNNGPVAWKARRQTCATLSSSEAEFVAAAMRDQKVIFLLALLRGLGHVQLKPTPTQLPDRKRLAVFPTVVAAPSSSEPAVLDPSGRSVESRWVNG